MNIEEVSEEDLFNDAVSDETSDDPVVSEQAVDQPEREPVRDGSGRFAKAEAEVEQPIVAEAEQKPAGDDSTGQIPAWRLREIREERDELKRQLEEARRAPAAQPKQEVAAPAKAEKPDPLLDPEGYEKYLDDKFEAKRLNDRRDMDLELTRQANTEAFDTAHNEAMRLKAAGDPAFAELAQKMQSTTTPGKVLMKWHQERAMKAEIGDDLAAFKQRQREELLKDPEFLAKAVEAARSSAQPQANGRPRVELPPSMSSASRSNALLKSSSNGDVSDEQLFQELAG